MSVTGGGWGVSLRSCDALIARLEKNDPTLEMLVILPNKSFSSAEVDRIASLLERGCNQQLRSIRASGHAIEPASLFRLGQAIAAYQSKVEELAIGNKDTGDDGVIALCNGLATGESFLQKIDLSYKAMGEKGFQTILETLGYNQHLTHLNLSRNPGIGSHRSLGEEAMYSEETETKKIFEHVVDLDLSDCNLCEEFSRGFFHALLPSVTSTSMNLMRTLRLSTNPMFGDSGFQHLSPLLLSTTELYLSDCGLTDTSVSHLSIFVAEHSVPLKILDLSSNYITSLGAESLAECLVDERDGTDDAKQSTRFLSKLVYLNLSGNINIGEDGCVRIANALQRRCDLVQSNSLTSLDVSNTNCNIRGAVELIKKSGVKSLCLANNSLSSLGFRELAVCLKPNLPKTLETLDLACNNADSESVAQLLSSFKPEDGNQRSSLGSLQTLVIGGNQTSRAVEDLAIYLKKINDDLDIARDKYRADTT